MSPSDRNSRVLSAVGRLIRFVDQGSARPENQGAMQQARLFHILAKYLMATAFGTAARSTTQKEGELASLPFQIWVGFLAPTHCLERGAKKAHGRAFLAGKQGSSHFYQTLTESKPVAC
jgi:hypothetical protein